MPLLSQTQSKNRKMVPKGPFHSKYKQVRLVRCRDLYISGKLALSGTFSLYVMDISLTLQRIHREHFMDQALHQVSEAVERIYQRIMEAIHDSAIRTSRRSAICLVSFPKVRTNVQTDDFLVHDVYDSDSDYSD